MAVDATPVPVEPAAVPHPGAAHVDPPVSPVVGPAAPHSEVAHVDPPVSPVVEPVAHDSNLPVSVEPVLPPVDPAFMPAEPEDGPVLPPVTPAPEPVPPVVSQPDVLPDEVRLFSFDGAARRAPDRCEAHHSETTLHFGGRS